MCWVLTSLAFAAAGRRIGPTAVNVTRIILALAVLAVINRLLFGRWVPPVEPRLIALLAVSGVIGLAIGDQLLFTALVDVGPRLSTLLMTSAPPAAALLAWPLLEESLGWAKIGGIAITLGGIVWVVLERPETPADASPAHPHRVRGVVFGILAGLCQAVGLVLSKLGMGHGSGATQPLVDPWTATGYRMAFAAVAVLVLAAALKLALKGRSSPEPIQISPEAEHLRPPSGPGRGLSFAIGMVGVGVVFGPVLGVWCSMVAVDRAHAGVAATLMAMTPVFILPFAIWIEKERVSWRAAIGAFVAVVGVAVLAVADGRGVS